MPTKRYMDAGNGNMIWKSMVVNSVFQLYGNEGHTVNTFRLQLGSNPTADSKVTLGFPCIEQNNHYLRIYPPVLPLSKDKRNTLL